MLTHSSHLRGVAGTGLSIEEIHEVVGEFVEGRLPRHERYWSYYRNPMVAVRDGAPRAGRWYRLAQEAGLPPRATGVADARPNAERREVVVENDIGWRVQAMVDFMFGKPLTIRSQAADPALRVTIERVLEAVWTASGGIALLQDLALLGHVHGHADLALRVDPRLERVAAEGEEAIVAAAAHLKIELIEPRRGVPITDPRDYRVLLGYVLRHGKGGGLEVIGPRSWVGLDHDRVAWEESLHLHGGRVPVVHVQNIAQPFEYSGQGEVEALIPLQDELNTRLSDRANRVTLQSFRMYLAKGIRGFEHARVGPGQIWSTDNVDASVEEFGGDASSPSEEQHIREVREALDKISGIPPLASGVVQAKIGNLSSANALRITLMAALSKTARKRVTYGGGIARMCELVLGCLHHAGVLATEERDRRVRLEWEDPLPQDDRERMQAAEAKARLGVSPEVILAELGYAPGEGASVTPPRA
jgi:hypothetical protein